MQANFINAGVVGSSVIHVKHGKETLEFSGAVYQGAFRHHVFDPFAQVNVYWNRLNPELLDRIFGLFIEAKEILNTVPQVTALIRQLRPVVEEIISIHDTPEYEHWIRRHAGVWIPEDLKNEYVFNHERPGSREQTYLVPDYWDLAETLLKVRPLAPIFGEFVEVTKRESGPTFRDLNAYYLITKSSIMDSPAMVRLNGYVAKNVKKDADNTRSAINGIGSDLFQINMISIIFIRALMVASLTKEPTHTHLVQVIFRAMGNKQSQSDSHQNAVLPKVNPNDSDDGEDSSSHAEKYKNKAPIPPGEITALEKYTEYTHDIAARLLVKNSLDEVESEELTRILNTIPDLNLEECQVQLIRWVTNPIIPPRAYWDINKSSVTRLACIAQFVLWNTGFKDLAGLVTARSINAEGVGSFGNESRAQIPKPLIEKLTKLFPFYRRHPTKKLANGDIDVVREICQLSDELSSHTWFLNLADTQLAETRGSASNKTYRLGYETRIRLSEYAIYSQERNAAYVTLYNF